MSVLDKFLYKLAICFFMLLTVVAFDRVRIIDYQGLRTEMSSHFNFLKLIETLNGNVDLMFLDFDEVQSANANLIQTVDIKNGKRVLLDTFEAVESLDLGIVVKIDGDRVYLLNNDDYLFCYTGLDNIDVSLYQIVRKNQIIGKASVNSDGTNYYDVYITKDKQFVDWNL